MDYGHISNNQYLKSAKLSSYIVILVKIFFKTPIKTLVHQGVIYCQYTKETDLSQKFAILSYVY